MSCTEPHLSSISRPLQEPHPLQAVAEGGEVFVQAGGVLPRGRCRLRERYVMDQNSIADSHLSSWPISNNFLFGVTALRGV